MKKKYVTSKYFEDKNGNPITRVAPPWYKVVIFKIRDFIRPRPVVIKEGGKHTYIIPKNISRKK